MVILVDSREQNKLDFPASLKYVESIETVKLNVGDYMVRFRDGYIPPIAIERKALGDLFSTLSGGYERFSREINRAVSGGIILVLVIEGDIFEVRRGLTYSKRTGESIINHIMTLYTKHGIAHQFFNSRAAMAYWIYKLFFSVGKLYVEDKLGFKSLTSKRIRELI